jgi:hypothetical protein
LSLKYYCDGDSILINGHKGILLIWTKPCINISINIALFDAGIQFV